MKRDVKTLPPIDPPVGTTRPVARPPDAVTPIGPIPGQQVQRHYTGNSGRQYHLDRHRVPEEAYLWVARQRSKKFTSVVTSESTVLEYGAGTGWNLALLQCKHRLGYDVADFLASQVKAHGVTFVADTKSLNDGAIDVVICHHVLEHLLEPPSALGEMRRLLRPGGTLWLSVPYEAGLHSRRLNRADRHHHLYSWNVQTLANLVQEAGFQVQQAGLGQFGYDRFAAVTSSRLHLGELGYQLITTGLHTVRPVREVRVIAKVWRA